MHDSAFSALQPGTRGQGASERIFPAKLLLLKRDSAMLFHPNSLPIILVTDMPQRQGWCCWIYLSKRTKTKHIQVVVCLH